MHVQWRSLDQNIAYYDLGKVYPMTSHQVFILSGGLGSSGERLVRTALAQFPDQEAAVTVIARVRSRNDLDSAFDAASSSGATVVHTLVDAKLRTELTLLAKDCGMVAVDAIGPLLDALTTIFGQRPVGLPGRYRKIHEDYFQRVEAIEFSVHHDDGRNYNELHLADIVLIGVSRSGKTPLSMYLAMRGYKTANVPLINEVEPPKELFEIDRRRVVGLTLDPERLVAYRRRRQKDLGPGTPISYSDPKQIVHDLEFARRIVRRGRFASIDVSMKPIEESANEVVAWVGAVPSWVMGATH
jgi:regulator of PEP synthase PpsR (kinase-PPPase family)